MGMQQAPPAPNPVPGGGLLKPPPMMPNMAASNMANMNNINQMNQAPPPLMGQNPQPHPPQQGRHLYASSSICLFKGCFAVAIEHLYCTSCKLILVQLSCVANFCDGKMIVKSLL